MAITKVSSGVISANAVTATIVAENVITSSEIATDGVGTLQIANDAVTSAKLDTNIDIAGTLDVTGVLTADSNVVIAGNLTVNGSTVTNSSTNTTIEDALIELGTGTTGTPANDAGIIIERGDSNNAFIGFDESADKFIVATTTATGSSTGDLTLTAAPLITGALTASGLAYPTSDGSANQVIKTDGSGNLSFVTAITDGAVVHNYTATGDGSTVTFDTGINPQDEVNTWVHIDGVYQNKSEYSYNGTSITFTSAPDSGAAIDIITGNQNGFSTADSVLGIYSATTTDTATYDTGLSASTENNVNIFIEGVYQPKSTYTWSGSTITFDANTPTGLALEVIASKTLTSGAVVTASITDSAVTTAKIADNAITSAKIVNNSITGADISATTNIVASTFTGALTGNVTGNVTGNLTGTIQTAAQPNITSVGTLTGLDVAGTPTFDGLTVDGTNGTVAIAADGNTVTMSRPSSNYFYASNASGDLFLGAGGTPTFLKIDNSGDISFYEDTGTTAKFFWDASAESLGIGTSSPSRLLDIENTSGDVYLSLVSNNTTGTSGLLLGDADADYVGRVEYYNSSNAMTLWTSNAERMRIDSSGRVGIGVTPNATTNFALDIQATSSGNALRLKGRSAAENAGWLAWTDNADNVEAAMYATANNLIFATTSSYTERMRIDASGLVGIGNTVAATLHAVSTVSNLVVGTGSGNNGIGVYSGSSNLGAITFADGTSGNATYRGGVTYNHNTDHLELNVNGGSAHVIVHASGVTSIPNGVELGSGVDATAANTLDDYEEGTFTPLFYGSSSGTAENSSSGYYTKIGRLVTVQVDVYNKTFGTYSGDLRMTLPFTAHTRPASGGDVYFYPNSAWDGVSNFVGFTPRTYDNAFLSFGLITNDSDRQTNISSSNTSTSGASGIFLRFSFTYTTDS